MKIIFEGIVGSQAYGTNTPESDIDIKGVYIQPNDDILSFRYKEQIDIGKDKTLYEVRRFIQLLKSANPTVLEMLYLPEECIKQKEPEFDLLIESRDKFLTKKCLASFAGYAVAQIQKARGLDKKMNWEASKVTRKTPLDFIYAVIGSQSKPILTWLKEKHLKQELCGLAAIDHIRDGYALYYDWNSHFGDKAGTSYPPLGYRGIVVEDSNALRLSSIPKGYDPECIIFYNKDGYSRHCLDYKAYTAWLENRNTQRFVDVKNHNQKIDGKNLLHCRRLIDMAIEIATNKTITVKRPNADYLLSIRKGEVNLEELIQQAEIDIKHLEELYMKSDLPHECDEDFANELLLNIRKFKL